MRHRGWARSAVPRVGNLRAAVHAPTDMRLRFAAVLALASALLACAALGVGGVALLHLMPAFLLGVVLLARRYPGESVLLRLARARTRRAPRPPASQLLHSPRPAAHIPRGALLMAFSLAVRPPPAVAAAS